jgi:hypothetical protein
MFAGMALALSGAQGFALDLVRDGKPVSSIVVADDATKVEQQAAQTLAKYLKMSSGADVPVVKESTNPATTLISVGKTRMAKAAGVTDADLKYDGYHLAVKGGALYLLGRDVPRTEGMPGHVGAQGSWRAALGLLERLGFRWVEPTPMGTHVPALKTVSVPDSLDITFRPPFIYMHPRMCAWGDWSQANNFRTAGLIYSGGDTPGTWPFRTRSTRSTRSSSSCAAASGWSRRRTTPSTARRTPK